MARHPKTAASIEDAERVERKLDLKQLVNEALSNLEVRTVFLPVSYTHLAQVLAGREIQLYAI